MNDSIKKAADLLKLRYDIMLGDLTFLAERFDSILESTPYITPGQAMVILYHLAVIYLRGRGYRLGNFRGFKAHVLKAAWVTTAVIARVQERGQPWYPRIHKLGIGELEKVVKAMNKPDILDQADDILRKHSRN